MAKALAVRVALLCLALWLLGLGTAQAQPAAYAPIHPHTGPRWGDGWGDPPAGWTVVHIEGAPRERGLQHGHLLATEIAAYIRALSEFWAPKAPAAAWAIRPPRPSWLPGASARTSAAT